MLPKAQSFPAAPSASISLCTRGSQGHGQGLASASSPRVTSPIPMKSPQANRPRGHHPLLLTPSLQTSHPPSELPQTPPTSGLQISLALTPDLGPRTRALPIPQHLPPSHPYLMGPNESFRPPGNAHFLKKNIQQHLFIPVPSTCSTTSLRAP